MNDKIVVRKIDLSNFLKRKKSQKEVVSELFNKEQEKLITTLVKRAKVRGAMEELDRHKPLLDRAYYYKHALRLQEELEALSSKKQESGDIVLNITLG